MTLLNVSFGIFAFQPLGWLFMAFVILFEGLVMTRLLAPKWFSARIYRVTAWTNMISGVVGIILSMLLNGGWYLVVWFPWVSENEVKVTQKGSLQFLIVYYAVAFLLTLIVETITNIIFMKEEHQAKRIVRATMIANVFSYTVGTVVLYSYSFR
jgi:hypothetical protein